MSASARCVEIPYGENGWHAHLHVLIRSEQWSESESETLLASFRAAVGSVRQTKKQGGAVWLGEECMPNVTRAIEWSEAFDGKVESHRGTYLAKLAFEISGVSEKLGKRGSHSPWQLARRAAAGDQAALKLWSEYAKATKGHRAFELDERATSAGKKQLIVDAFEREELEGAERKTFEVVSSDFRALARAECEEPGILARVLESVEKRGKEAITEWVAYARELRSGTVAA